MYNAKKYNFRPDKSLFKELSVIPVSNDNEYACMVKLIYRPFLENVSIEQMPYFEMFQYIRRILDGMPLEGYTCFKKEAFNKFRNSVA